MRGGVDVGVCVAEEGRMEKDVRGWHGWTRRVCKGHKRGKSWRWEVGSMVGGARTCIGGISQNAPLLWHGGKNLGPFGDHVYIVCRGVGPLGGG